MRGSVDNSVAGSLLPRRLNSLRRGPPLPSTGSNNEKGDDGGSDTEARLARGRGGLASLVGALGTPPANSERDRRQNISQKGEEGGSSLQTSTPATGLNGNDGAVDNRTRAGSLVPIMSKLAVKARRWVRKGHLLGGGASAEAVPENNHPLAKIYTPGRTTPNASDLPPVEAETCAGERLPARTSEQLVSTAAVVSVEGGIVTGVVRTRSTSSGQDGHLCSTDTASGDRVRVPANQTGAHSSAIIAKPHSAESGGLAVSQPPMGSGRLPMNPGGVAVNAVGHQPRSHDSGTKKCDHSVTASPPSTLGQERDGTVSVSPREVQPMASDGGFMSDLDGVRRGPPPSRHPTDEGGGRSPKLVAIAPSNAGEDEISRNMIS